MKGNIEKKICPENTVHHVLAHSYLVYFAMFLFGILLNIFFPIKFLGENNANIFGFIFLLLGTFLIFWAQYSSHKHRKHRVDPKSLPHRIFYKGPYKYTRMPTHIGLFLLMLGFSFIVNALFLVLSTLFAFVLTKSIFLKKEERLLEEEFGLDYTQYKKSVRF